MVYTPYPTGGLAPPAKTAGSDTTTTTSSPEESNTASTERSKTSSSAPSSTSSATDFNFIELHDGIHVFPLREEHFLAAEFESICLSQNCQKDCLNLTRVFTANEDDLQDSSDGNSVDIPVTLFGICSNLANATSSASLSGDSRVQSFFPSTLAEMNTDIELITSNLTTCLSTTCEMTREPSECVDHCRPQNLLRGPTLFTFSPGIFECTHRICSSTCGLPYANQDVFGIGVGDPHIHTLSLSSWLALLPTLCVTIREAHLLQVLVSYYIQAVLLFLLASATLISAALQIWRLGRRPIVVGSKTLVDGMLESFLATQCYFGGKMPGNLQPSTISSILTILLQ